MSWDELFERAGVHDVAVEAVTAAIRRYRAARESGDGEEGGAEDPAAAGNAGGDRGGEEAGGSDPIARVVADADVLAADILVGGAAREALDLVRAHSWVRLVASDPLLSAAQAAIGDLADESLAAEWRTAVDARADLVEHNPGDHPALASAASGRARHVLSLDDRLLTASAGAAIRARVETSVKRPDAFVRLFDPAVAYETAVGGAYPGPDRDPRG